MTDAIATQPVELVDLDFGDTDFKVVEHPDGMTTVHVGGEGLLVNAEQFQQIVLALMWVASDKGWR